MLDLDRPRDLNGILGATFGLYGQYFGVFAAIALAVVIPLDFLTLGVLDGYLTSGFNEDDSGGGIAYSIVQTLVITPLITGSHVAAVMAIGHDERPGIGGSLAAAGAALPALIATVILMTLSIFVGFLLLIVPGIYVAVRLFVASQAVVAESCGPADALKRSWDLVEDNWWRVLGIAIVLVLISLLLGGAIAIPVTVLAVAADSGALFMVLSMLLDAVVLSFTALAGTLLFFDLRARKAESVPTEPAPQQQPWGDRPKAPPGA